MERINALAIAGLAAAALLANRAEAQGLARRITGAPDGEVRMTFAARPDVCGDGVNNIRWGSRHQSRRERDDHVVYGDDGACPCGRGPVRVVFRVRDHRVSQVRTSVGGEWRPDPKALDLGAVSTRDAVPALLAIAADGANGGGEHAVFATILADSTTVWPELLRLARSGAAPLDSRRQAVFWLSQAAGDSATAGLVELADAEKEGDDIRKQAVFALSQRPREEGVPALIRIAKQSRSAEVRRTALFWLGQSDDPRALALFEEILTRK